MLAWRTFSQYSHVHLTRPPEVSALAVDEGDQWLFTASKDNSLKAKRGEEQSKQRS